MTLFDPTSLGTVTRVVDRAGWSAIYVGRKRVARVPSKRAAALNIAPGVEWTPALAAAAALAADTVKAKKKALSLLKVKDRTAHELRDRLVAAGHPPTGVDAALAELAREGLLNDSALARASLERDLAKGHSPRAAAHKLATRGIHDADMPSPPTGELERAVAAAQARAAKLPPDLPPHARARRLLAALARLGYEEDTARDAAVRVLGFAAFDQEPL